MRRDDAWSTPGAPSGAPPPTAAGSGPAPAVAPSDPGGPGAVALAPDRPAAGVAIARGDERFPPPDDSVPTTPLADAAPVGPGGVLDGGFELLRFRFGRVVGLTAVLLLPLQVVALLVALTRPAGSVTSLEDPFATGALGAVDSSDGLGLAVTGLRGIALALVGIAVGYLAQGWWEGRDPPFREALGVMARRWWVAVVAAVSCWVLKAPLLCLGGIGWFLGDALLFTTCAAAGAERLGPFAAIKRVVRLNQVVFGPALVVCLGGFVISQVLQVALVVGPLLLAASFDPPEGWLLAVEQATSLVLLITVPLTACIAARAHVEFRCRVEGADLARRQERRGLD